MQVSHRQGEEAVTAQVEDYLDHVLAPLVGRVPYDRRKQLRAELTDHLEALVEARTELGESREEATAAALRQFGDPTKIAGEWLGEWRPKSAFPPRSARLAAACFLPASALAWFIATVTGPGQSPPSVFFVLTVIPIFTGFVAGMLARSRPGAGTMFGVLGLALITGLLGMIEVFVFRRIEHQVTMPLAILAAVEACIWAPIGAIAATAGGAVRRRVLTVLRAVGSV